MAEDIAHPIAEAVAQIGDDFVRGAAARTVEAAVFHQSDGGARLAQRVIGAAIRRRIQSAYARVASVVHVYAVLFVAKDWPIRASIIILSGFALFYHASS
ncbi:MAG: hypothetical protein ACREQ7_16610 [Candidatus Binatia bacterium]